MSKEVLEGLASLRAKLEEQGIFQKEVLTFNEACTFVGLSPSYLYKLTSTSKIPHYKPEGKKVFFKRSELEQWLLRNKVKSISELDQQADSYLIKKGGVK